MALDGILLYKIIPQIRDAAPMRIQKIYQISTTEILLQTHGAKKKQQLLISTHSVYNRLLFTDRSYPTPAEPGNFVMVLRKHIEGGIIESIEQAELDRWCTMRVRRMNELGDLEYYDLVIELMGKYANVILVKDGIIVDALKRIPPFENTRRTILPQAAFVPTP
ncbi:MAG: NFACT family protein, partial [Solobacterium sp.]|nr:NFACT family protein [Solobacterium sp.]